MEKKGLMLLTGGLAAVSVATFFFLFHRKPDKAAAALHWEKGMALVQAWKLNEASREVREALALDPANSRYETSLGFILLKEDNRPDVERAASIFASVSKRPGAPLQVRLGAKFGLGEALRWLARAEGGNAGARLLAKSIAVNAEVAKEKGPEGRAVIGRACIEEGKYRLRQGEYKRALDWFRKAVPLLPPSGSLLVRTDLHSYICDCEIMLGEKKEFLRDFQRLVATLQSPGGDPVEKTITAAARAPFYLMTEELVTGRRITRADFHKFLPNGTGGIPAGFPGALYIKAWAECFDSVLTLRQANRINEAITRMNRFNDLIAQTLDAGISRELKADIIRESDGIALAHAFTGRLYGEAGDKKSEAACYEQARKESRLMRALFSVFNK